MTHTNIQNAAYPHDLAELDLGSGDGAGIDHVRLDEAVGPVLHRDLSQIEVSDLDGITINRTKSGISPFVSIVKTPTYSKHSGTHTGFAVEIEDPGSDTGYRHVGNVSNKYLLLSNEEVRELALEIALESGLNFRESRIFWDGARFAHVIDFLEREEIVEGDEVGLSLITRSSYDKSWRYECALMGKRFVCDNGAISGEFFARVSFKHLASANEEGTKEEAWKEIVRQGMSVIDRAPQDLYRFVEAMRRMKAARMTDTMLRRVWQALPSMGDLNRGQILSRYVDQEEPTLFGLFQAGTWVFSHREKMTAADFANNDVFTTNLLQLAEEQVN